MMIVNRIIAFVIGYLCGMILIGYVYSKIKKRDITQMGSGNAGTTNTLRVFGWKAGLITFLGDCFKPILAIFITWLIFHKSYPDAVRLLELYAGVGAIIGHNHPFYMKNFKGGKGVACTAGIILAFCPIEIPICLLLFIGAVAITKYVSLGSLLVVISFFIQMVVFGQLGFLNVTTDHRIEVYILAGLVMLMGITRHKENIKRLLNGCENKISLHKKEEGAA